MASNGSGQSYRFPVGFNRGKFAKTNQPTETRNDARCFPFSVPPPDLRAATGPAMSNAIQRVTTADSGFLNPIGPQAYQNNGTGYMNGTNGPPRMMNPQICLVTYQNPNIWNQVVIKNNAPTMMNPCASLGCHMPLSIGGTGEFTGGIQYGSTYANPPMCFEGVQCVQSPSCEGPKPTTPPMESITDHFEAMINTALNGCKLAGVLASSNQTRPCFKRIDTLCTNLEMDLVKPDNVMANINSQGLAWAVKDFIFVFTRIINAWSIIKGYVHSQPTGLAKLRDELCPNFMVAFSRWHLASYELTQSLITSFVKLDKLAKKQRSGPGGHVNAKQGSQGTEGRKMSAESLDIPTQTSKLLDTDESYIRTGLYDHPEVPPGVAGPPRFAGANVAFPLSDPDTDDPYIMVSPRSTKSDPSESDCSDRCVHVHRKVEPTTKSFLDRRILVKLHGEETANLIEGLLEQIFALDEAKYFIILNFTKNYFPDFQLVAAKCSDLRTILTNAELGSYRKVDELVDDLQQLVDACNKYIEAFEMFDLPKYDANAGFKRTNVQKREVENIPTMQRFVAKVECILRRVLSLDGTDEEAALSPDSFHTSRSTFGSGSSVAEDSDSK